MKKQAVLHSPDAPSTGGYSPAVISDGWLYISGHGSLDTMTGEVVPGDIQQQTERVLTNIGSLLAKAGCSFSDVVKCTCHLAAIGDFDVFDATYRKFFNGVLPARTTVQSVLWGPLKVEIDAIARIP